MSIEKLANQDILQIPMTCYQLLQKSELKHTRCIMYFVETLITENVTTPFGIKTHNLFPPMRIMASHFLLNTSRMNRFWKETSSHNA